MSAGRCVFPSFASQLVHTIDGLSGYIHMLQHGLCFFCHLGDTRRPDLQLRGVEWGLEWGLEIQVDTFIDACAQRLLEDRPSVLQELAVCCQACRQPTSAAVALGFFDFHCKYSRPTPPPRPADLPRVSKTCFKELFAFCFQFGNPLLNAI